MTKERERELEITREMGECVHFSGRAGMICPICTTGALNYTVASYNGHMHAMCTSEGCVRWME